MADQADSFLRSKSDSGRIDAKLCMRVDGSEPLCAAHSVWLFPQAWGAAITPQPKAV